MDLQLRIQGQKPLEIKVWKVAMPCCISRNPCGSIPAAKDHNRLSHYHPLMGEERVLQDRESRSHCPTENTLRLLAGFDIQDPKSPAKPESRDAHEGHAYAS